MKCLKLVFSFGTVVILLCILFALYSLDDDFSKKRNMPMTFKVNLHSDTAKFVHLIIEISYNEDLQCNLIAARCMHFFSRFG